MRAPILLSLALLACFEKGGDEDDGAGLDDGGAADGGAADGGAADGGAADGGGDSGWWEEDPGDADGDGYTVEEGDCDDGDGTVHPGASDATCDGSDDDCDEQVDEDFDRDGYEPNDDEGYDLGEIEHEGDALVVAWLWPESDEDAFLFYVEDGDWSWFDVELWLYDVPDDADYALELRQVEDVDGDYVGLVGSADDGGRGGEELVNYGGSYGFDDSGWYEARVLGVDGARCDTPYTLQILVGSWR